jgi:serine/threonine protein kinase
MKNIQHPNIVEFYDYYSDKKSIYLVLELLGGGELYEEIM